MPVRTLRWGCLFVNHARMDMDQLPGHGFVDRSRQMLERVKVTEGQSLMGRYPDSVAFGIQEDPVFGNEIIDIEGRFPVDGIR